MFSQHRPMVQAPKESQDGLPKNILIYVVLHNHTNMPTVQSWNLDHTPHHWVGPIRCTRARKLHKDGQLGPLSKDQAARTGIEAYSFKMQDTTIFFFFLVISFDLVLRAMGSKEIFIQEESFGSRSMDDCSSWKSWSPKAKTQKKVSLQLLPSH